VRAGLLLYHLVGWAPWVRRGQYLPILAAAFRGLSGATPTAGLGQTQSISPSGNIRATWAQVFFFHDPLCYINVARDALSQQRRTRSKLGAVGQAL
jgi:hypothetical protein